MYELMAPNPICFYSFIVAFCPALIKLVSVFWWEGPFIMMNGIEVVLILIDSVSINPSKD